MKITIPRKNQGKPLGGYHRKRKPSQEWLHGRKGPSGQKPQSPVKTWADMTPEERAEIILKLKNK